MHSFILTVNVGWKYDICLKKSYNHRRVSSEKNWTAISIFHIKLSQTGENFTMCTRKYFHLTLIKIKSCLENSVFEHIEFGFQHANSLSHVQFHCLNREKIHVNAECLYADLAKDLTLLIPKTYFYILPRISGLIFFLI